MRYLLDTNICIYLTRHHPPSVRKRFAEIREGDAAMSSITYGELYLGAALDVTGRNNNRAQLSALRQVIASVDFDEGAARTYAELTAALPSGERRRNVIDRMIAAHAISLDVTLVTTNERDFAAYAEVGGLRVENWVAG
jgi:tRNA(fMet)-specific endonuclease VapC